MLKVPADSEMLPIEQGQWRFSPGKLTRGPRVPCVMSILFYKCYVVMI